jgi:5'-deoxynucleotidase YfbR-like HD superfamily hydrolase
MMALTTVNRWAIVDMVRPQSVAEHSYRVWVLVHDLYGLMFPVEHNTFEFMGAQWHALTHDAEEVYTGDLPTTVKVILEKLSPGITYKLKEEVLKDKMPNILTRMRGIGNTFPAHLVKIAETVEAILYLREYCVSFNRRVEVESTLITALNEHLKTAAVKYRSIPWDRARDWCDDLLRPQPTPMMAMLAPSVAV